MAIAIFNRAKDEAKITVKPADLKLTGKWKARDLWTHQDVAWPDSEYSVTIPSHGVMMLRLSR